jgi:anti-anti-sigma factor
MRTALHWTVDRQHGVSQIRVEGELDIASTPSFEQALLGVHGPLVIDCAEMTFLGSAGLATFARVFETNTSLTLRNVRDSCRKVLEVGGMTGLVALEER